MAIVLVFVILATLFIIWQFRVLAKYNFGYPAIKLDLRSSRLIVDKKSIRFKDIKAIRIVPEVEQPSTIEKGLSKGAAYVYLSTIEIYMNDESVIPIKCNSKGIIKNLIKNAEHLPELIYNEDDFEEHGLPPLVAGGLFIILLYIIVSIITSSPH